MTTCKHADSGCNYPEGECLGVCMASKNATENELCPNCGSSVHVHYGPDIRFVPPCSRPMMYRAECSGDCLDPSWTDFTYRGALERWNRGIQQSKATRSASHD